MFFKGLFKPLCVWAYVGVFVYVCVFVHTNEHGVYKYVHGYKTLQTYTQSYTHIRTTSTHIHTNVHKYTQKRHTEKHKYKLYVYTYIFKKCVYIYHIYEIQRQSEVESISLSLVRFLLSLS